MATKTSKWWGRIDGSAWQSDKLAQLSCAAERLYWVAISYANGEHTGGVLSMSAIRMLAAHRGIDNYDAVTAELVGSKCWEYDGSDIRIHDFAQYSIHPELSAKRSEAGRRGAVARWSNGRLAVLPDGKPSSKNGKTDGKSIAEKTVATNVATTVATDVATKFPNGNRAVATAPPAVVKRLFAAWVQATDRDPQRVKFTAIRAARIKARLGEGYSEADIVAAFMGWRYDDWDRRHLNNDIPDLIGNSVRLEKFRDLYTRHGQPRTTARVATPQVAPEDVVPAEQWKTLRRRQTA